MRSDFGRGVTKRYERKESAAAMAPYSEVRSARSSVAHALMSHLCVHHCMLAVYDDLARGRHHKRGDFRNRVGPTSQRWGRHIGIFGY